ncbi:3-carboxy-cis,cis-muconate cycloisomerase [Rhodococcoides fascians]|uniref:3-carboxy-cis,cis-muconate cycloisomerase n=1 Tax=Rhodococcoides fascians TaxID=1828 RepID=UPI001D22234D|nr:3-carboxy-cis,cis-muconate cycloisomerase [Rhodococcus fascians]MDJ0411324.1 3-carboxy-cis,cis-muconate cycloisomerase [Rhodococcus fascians]CAH0239850.1 3-carboxy-cis,cis-muconate cycloisomerase [Rhodococcus fascians]
MASDRGALFDPTFGSEIIAPIVGDRGWVRAMFDVEAALSRAAASVGVVDAKHADIITAVAAELGESLDITALGAAAAAGGNPVIPLVKVLRNAVSASGVPAAAVHPGATSQDIMDTASMLVARDALTVVEASVGDAHTAARGLALAHRTTPMVARTLGQQALPTTFGLVAANWAGALHRSSHRLAAVRRSCCVQYGGAAGTMAAVHPHGPAIAAALADALGLAPQTAPWHTDRVTVADLACALGIAAGSIAKIAGDIVSMSATELAEVSENAPGGSSAMPHKRNPIAAITARAAARRVPGAVATVLANMDHEQQRAAGPWHAEWETVTDLLRLTGGGAHRIATSLTGLHVHPDAMARNLEATGGALLAERVTAALAPHTERARDIVTDRCAAGAPLDTDPAITAFLTPAAVREMLNPAGYVGHAPDLVDVILAACAPDTERPTDSKDI